MGPDFVRALRSATRVSQGWLTAARDENEAFIRKTSRSRKCAIFISIASTTLLIFLYGLLSRNTFLISKKNINVDERLWTSHLLNPDQLGLRKVAAAKFMDTINSNHHKPPCNLFREGFCNFIMVADLDEASRIEGNSTMIEFRSYLKRGQLHWDGGQFSINLESGLQEITGKLNEGGRGLELSELVNFRGHLLTFDDRTGIIYDIRDEGLLIPRFILAEGDGYNSGKGMKVEWATVKDDTLFVGSFGKEYTDKTGTVISEANMWVYAIDSFGRIERRNWKPLYNILCSALSITQPGYMIHEAVRWSSTLLRWVILPRRVSHEPYDELMDERRGANIILLASEDFSAIRVIPILSKNTDPLRGFSSFAFVPGTSDRWILCLRSLEDSSATPTLIQRSYVTMVEVSTGKVELEDIEIPHMAKFEGLEFFPL